MALSARGHVARVTPVRASKAVHDSQRELQKTRGRPKGVTLPVVGCSPFLGRLCILKCATREGSSSEISRGRSGAGRAATGLGIEGSRGHSESKPSTKGKLEKGFHQSRFAASKRPENLQQESLSVQIRAPTSDRELNAVAVLRALSFYAYRPDRAYAGKLHQKMKAGEEFERLLRLQENQSRPEQQEACLAAFCRWETVPGAPEELRVTSSSGEELALVGSLDVCAARGVEGQVLIGASRNAAYLSNVCVSEAARRRSVGGALLEEARKLAAGWGVDALYVHTMAVNEIAQEFYSKHGFVLEREESSNEAHYRGQCLDGIEGRGRTVLLRDESFKRGHV